MPRLDVVDGSRAARGSYLPENESLDLLESFGVATPRRLIVESAAAAEALDLDALGGERVVVKAVAPGLIHKTEVGAVKVAQKSSAAVVAAIREIEAKLTDVAQSGYLVVEWVEHDAGIGGEMLLAVRWTDDFGPVVTLGPGGIHAEFLGRHLERGRGPAILAASLDPGQPLEAALGKKAFLSLLTEPQRGLEPSTDLPRLADLVRKLLAVAERSMPHELVEIEINPLVFRDKEAIALDAVVRLAGEPPRVAPARPLHKLDHLFRPRSLAIMGVSRRQNPGRIVLDNVLESGFDPGNIHIIKPGHETLAGCRCVPDLASLPAPVDLAVLCIGASELPAVVEEVVAGAKAEALILIAGGLGERPGSETHGRAVADLIEASRESVGGGPVVNGGNCLGVRSTPGRYDTLFIPQHKLSYPEIEPTPLALISQSGALAVAKASALAELNPRYLVSLGNQIDLTMGDYLTYLDDDPEVRVFACYVEGFQPLDGARWLEAADRITRSGRPVILYRAGRTESGSRAAATHTASIAGDYAVTRELASAAGVLVAETLEDFEDLTRLACALDRRTLEGRRLGALSNAGFECVAIADGLDGLELAELSRSSHESLDRLLADHHLSTVVGVGNPLDVTPILGDETFVEACRLVLRDDHVDLGIVGCVPLTGALQTLPRSADHGEDCAGEGSVVQRLGRLWESIPKAWVAAVDGGPIYDPMAHLLAAQGIPVFRSIDRATRLLATYADWRLRSR